MNFEIIPTDFFNRELKKLYKKHKSIKYDLSDLFQELEQNPKLGIALGNDCYKIRLAISSKGKGKSGGARVITYVVIKKSTLYLLALYDKSEKDNITDKEIKQLINQLNDL